MQKDHKLGFKPKTFFLQGHVHHHANHYSQYAKFNTIDLLSVVLWDVLLSKCPEMWLGLKKVSVL